MSLESYLNAVRQFHEKHDLANNVGSQLTYRICLMAEELGELAACVTKGADHEQLAEEHADLLILLLGNCVVANINIETAFWEKMKRIMERKSIETPLGPRITETTRGDKNG